MTARALLFTMAASALAAPALEVASLKPGYPADRRMRVDMIVVDHVGKPTEN